MDALRPVFVGIGVAIVIAAGVFVVMSWAGFDLGWGLDQTRPAALVGLAGLGLAIVSIPRKPLPARAPQPQAGGLAR